MIDDVTVCIPTIPGREAFVFRAVESAREQARVVVNNGGGRADLAYLNWWQAIYSAHTKYVGLLFDDDWYEPTFVARTREWMSDSVAWVATNATIHRGGRTSLNINGKTPGTWPSDRMAEGLLKMPYTITPSCVLMRRDEALSTLLVGGVPMGRTPVANAGCDALMLLFMLTAHPTVEWIDEPLVNLDGGDQSTTIREMQKGTDDLLTSYREAKGFFYRFLCGSRSEDK